MKEKLTNFFLFKNNNSRTKLLKFNIVGLFFLKAASIFISFLMVPITINYLNTYEYGIWITISTILIWVDFFDIGIGHGLRNKLAIAIANNDFELGKSYISTAIAFTTVLSLFFLIIFSIINPFLNWSEILNIESSKASYLSGIIYWVFLFVCLRFILKLFGIILAADQRPALENLIGVIGNFISFIVIIVLTKTTKGSLQYVALSLSAISPIVFAISGFIIFNSKRYGKLRPSFNYIDRKHVKDLLGLGLKFFVIQISCLLIFTSSDFIIIHIFGPKQVTVYNIGYKYFSIIIMIYTILSSPLWSAFTNAHANNDFEWIKNTVNRLQKFWFFCSLVVVVMILFAQSFFKLWVADKVQVPFSLVLSLGLYSIVNNLLATYNYVINGTGKILIQSIYSIFSMIFYLPLAFYFSEKFGISGAINASTLILIPQIILTYIQYNKIINRSANGIWNR